MVEKNSTTSKNMVQLENNIYVRINKLHKTSFLMMVLALSTWTIVRITLAHLSGETQTLITQHFYLAGWFIWGLTGVFLLSALLLAGSAIQSSTDKAHAVVVWMLYLSTISVIAFFFTAFRISAIGLHGVLTGLDNTSNNATYLLIKFYPYLPFTPVNLLTSSRGNPSQYLDMISSLSDITYLYMALLGASFLSFLLRRDNRFVVFLALLFAVTGIGFTYLTETGFRDIPQTLSRDLPRIAPMLNYFFSCLATLLTGIIFYSTARSISFKKVTKEKVEKIFRPLPPTTFRLLIIFILLAPSLADVENVHSLERKGRTITTSQNQAASPYDKTTTNAYVKNHKDKWKNSANSTCDTTKAGVKEFNNGYKQGYSDAEAADRIRAKSLLED